MITISKANKKLFFALFMVSSAFLFFSGGKASAVSSTYPETWSSGHYLTASRNGNGINLDAPYSYMKVKFSSNTYYYDIEVYDGCWWRGSGSIDGGTVSPANCRNGDAEFFFCPSNPDGTYNSSYKTNGRCYRTDPSGWPSAKLGPQNHRFKQNGTAGTAWPLDMPVVGGTDRFIYIIAEMKVAGSNAFRVTSRARNSSGSEVSSMTTLAGLGGNLSLPLSIGYMPLTPGGSQTMRTRFQVPCSPATNNFQLGWFDADRPPGGIPYDTDIRWRLINTTNGGQDVTSAEWAFISGMNEDDFLGSNNVDRTITISNNSLIRVQAGDEYTFEWTNVNSNNGVQFKLPFDEVDRGASCNPPTGSLTGTPEASCNAITGNANDADSSGTALLIRVYKNATINMSDLSQNQVGTYPNANNNFSVSIASHKDFDSDTYYVYARDVNQSGTPTGTYSLIGSKVVGPCLEFKCGQATTNPANPNPGAPFDMTVSFDVVNIGSGTSASIGSLGNSRAWHVRLRVSPGVLEPAQPIGSGTLAPGGASSISATKTGLSAPLGTYDAFWSVSATLGGAVLTPPGVCNEPDAVTVTEKPFFRVLNGDIAAGVTTVASGCQGWGVSSGPASSLTAWNNDIAGATNVGAGTNLAVISGTGILGVASAQGRNSPPSPPQPLTGLSFSSFSFNNYGGFYPNDIPCPTDYYDLRNNVPTVAFPSNPGAVPSTNNVYTFGSDLTINGGAIGLNNRPVVFVEGNVLINNNITLASGAATVDSLPNLYIIARGNIYIAPGVTRLDGIYVAQPDIANNRGRIYTCSNGFAVPTAVEINGACRTNSLDVNGAFIAKELKLYRSFGSLSGNVPAERFNITPNTWLAAPCIIAGCGSTGADGVDSITSLPPIL